MRPIRASRVPSPILHFSTSRAVSLPSPFLTSRRQLTAQSRRSLLIAPIGGYAGNSDSEDFTPTGGYAGNSDSEDFIPFYELSAADKKIGAEYGEGFLQFRLSGEKTRLDVDTLNEELQVKGAARIRHSMHPDEAHGLIFDFDDVVVDTRELHKKAWKAVAEAEGLRFPEIERPHMYEMRPERAAMHVLQWTNDMKRAQELAWLVATAYVDTLQTIEEPLPGVVDWMSLMSKTNVPCALVTAMDRSTTTNLLDKLGLRHFFSALVTADDDMETIAQRYLSACIKLNRPPNQCVVFGASPAAIAAAHNCTMRAVALIGTCTAPQLRAADLTIGSMTELSVVNIRRLFANRGTEFMDLNKSRIGEGPAKRKLRHATDDDEPPR